MPGLRWWIAGLLMLATVVNYLDRQCLSLAGPVLEEQLSIDEQTFSYIVTAFLVTYGLMQPVAGRMMDWVGTRLGFILAVTFWSVANMLHGFARSWRALAAFRVLLGIGEAGNFPGSVKTISEWFPPKERTIATGIFNSGASLGMLIAYPLIASVIIPTWGWQTAFVATGATGFLWLILWIIFYQPPEKHPWLTERERAIIQGGKADLAVAEPPPEKGVWRIVLPQRNFWALAIARFFAEPAWQFYMYWTPLYLYSVHNMNIKEIGYFGWVPYLAADLGCLVGGLFSPFFQRLGLKVLTARKASATVSALIMACAGLVVFTHDAAWAIFFISVATFAHQTLSSTLLTLPADLFPKRTVGSAYGLAGTAGYAGGSLFMLIVGVLASHKLYAPIFITLAFLDVIGVTMLWLLVRAPKAETGTLAPPPVAA